MAAPIRSSASRWKSMRRRIFDPLRSPPACFPRPRSARDNRGCCQRALIGGLLSGKVPYAD